MSEHFFWSEICCFRGSPGLLWQKKQLWKEHWKESLVEGDVQNLHTGILAIWPPKSGEEQRSCGHHHVPQRSFHEIPERLQLISALGFVPWSQFIDSHRLLDQDTSRYSYVIIAPEWFTWQETTNHGSSSNETSIFGPLTDVLAGAGLDPTWSS